MNIDNIQENDYKPPVFNERTGELKKQNGAMALKAEQECIIMWIWEGIALVNEAISRK